MSSSYSISAVKSKKQIHLDYSYKTDYSHTHKEIAPIYDLFGSHPKGLGEKAKTCTSSKFKWKVLLHLETVSATVALRVVNKLK